MNLITVVLSLKPKAQPGLQHNEAQAGHVALTTAVLKWPRSYQVALTSPTELPPP